MPRTSLKENIQPAEAIDSGKVGSMSRVNRSIVYISIFTSFIFSFYYLLLLVILSVKNDIILHVEIIEAWCGDREALPANFGFYKVVHLISGFTCNLRTLLLTASLVLGLAWGATVFVSGRLAKYVLAVHGEELVREHSTIRTTVLILLAAVCSCLLFPLPVSTSVWYLGLLPPNVYHNSTIISALPFGIAAFAIGVRRLTTATVSDPRTDLLLASLLVLGTAFKPSFAFAFLPAYGLIFAWKVRFQVAALLPLILSLLPVSLFILWQLVWTNQHQGVNVDGPSHLVLGLAGWHTFLPNYQLGHVVACAISSFALPILAYVMRPDWLRKLAHLLAVLCVFMAMAVFMLVHETGLRASHGNFTWQVVAANHILHWVVLLETCFWSPTTVAQKWRRRIIMGFAGLEILCGVAFLIHLVR